MNEEEEQIEDVNEEKKRTPFPVFLTIIGVVFGIPIGLFLLYWIFMFVGIFLINLIGQLAGLVVIIAFLAVLYGIVKLFKRN